MKRKVWYIFEISEVILTISFSETISSFNQCQGLGSDLVSTDLARECMTSAIELI